MILPFRNLNVEFEDGVTPPPGWQEELGRCLDEHPINWTWIRERLFFYHTRSWPPEFMIKLRPR